MAMELCSGSRLLECADKAWDQLKRKGNFGIKLKKEPETKVSRLFVKYL